MIRFIAFLSLCCAIQGKSVTHPSGFRTVHNGKIVGGSSANVTEFPWQVALEDGGYQYCAGSILSENYILTAARCTDGSNPRYITVRYGTNKLETGGTTVQIEKIFQNPDFTQSRLDYDISVIQLAESIVLSESAQPITLRFEEASAGENATVAGWGTSDEGDSELSDVLQKVIVPIVSRNSCNGPYAGVITDRMICAGESGKGSCVGDAGGALTVRNKQVGVHSWGYGCAEEGYPGVYSNIVALKEFIDNSSNNEAKWD